MRKFKLIKKDPKSFKILNVGDVVIKVGFCYQYKRNGTSRWFIKHEVENNPEYWQEITEEEPTDPIVDSVIERFKSRSQEGIKKYGTTLESNNSLSIIDWINHAQEEGMDRLLYLEKLKSEITKLVNKVTN
jgi:hypothetical protein